MTARGFWVWLHRWAGLTTAGFLILVGLTGSLLAFLPEINHSLTPQLFPGPHGPELEAPILVRRAEKLVPEAKATAVHLGWPGTAMIRMETRPGSPSLDFDYLHLDAVTGAELGRVNRGAIPRALAVPTNGGALSVFRYHVLDIWRRALRRRSQKDRTTWLRITKLGDDYLPKPHILHPWPRQRFIAKHPRWEPYAGKPHVRICAGGA